MTEISHIFVWWGRQTTLLDIIFHKGAEKIFYVVAPSGFETIEKVIRNNGGIKRTYTKAAPTNFADQSWTPVSRQGTLCTKITWTIRRSSSVDYTEGSECNRDASPKILWWSPRSTATISSKILAQSTGNSSSKAGKGIFYFQKNQNVSLNTVTEPRFSSSSCLKVAGQFKSYVFIQIWCICKSAPTTHWINHNSTADATCHISGHFGIICRQFD